MKNLFFGYFVFFFSVILFISCNRHIAPQASIIFPAPPDTARIQFLTRFGGSQDIVKQAGFSKVVLGANKPLPIYKPYGVAIHKNNIYVCDNGVAGLEIIGLEKRTFRYFTPKGNGQLKNPINCFVDDQDKLYIADGDRKQIVIFNSKGEYLNAFGEADKFKPTDVFVYGKKIWVANILNNKIYVYDRDSVGKLLFTFPESSPGNEDYLYSPVNLFIENDKVYVSDIGGFNVKIYDLNGKYLQTVGSYGRNRGQFGRNKGVTVDKNGNIYVVDASFDNAQIFNKEGNLLMAFGGPYTGPGYMWLPAKITIDYKNLEYFRKYVDPAYKLKYIILVTNQYGPDKLSVYGAIEPDPNYKPAVKDSDNKQKKKK
jgi:sugar lactone lactonase YvrE